MNCFCCSGLEFADCCQPFIDGTAKPSTPEALMRSRYSAYAVADVAYLLRTTHPSVRKLFEPDEIEQWAKSSIWQKLEIIAASPVAPKDKRATVEFKAFYLDENRVFRIHHEESTFSKELGRWFFVDGKILGDSI